MFSDAKLQKSFYTLLFKKLEICITLLVEVFTPLAVKSQCVLREHAPAVNLIYPLLLSDATPFSSDFLQAGAGRNGWAGRVKTGQLLRGL